MKTIRNGYLLIFMLLLGVSHFSAAKSVESLQELHYFTENYPPANFHENDKVTGYAVEILMAASALANDPIDLSQITLQPWARSYRTVLTKPNTVLFSTSRSEHRESLFQWVGPIHPLRIVVMARKDANITINQPMDMANYRIGVIRDDIGEQSLLAFGLPRDAMQEASYVATLAEQLAKNRIDLLAYSERAAHWWTRKAEISPQLFEAVYVLKEGELYYAFNKDINPSLVDRLQRGLDELKTRKGDSGKTLYEEIMEKY